MQLKLYNTAIREIAPFIPLNPDRVSMYVCGPTVYDFAHIGNARPVVIFDVLYRFLKTLYPNVTYVRNITDVDDKINAKSAATGESIDIITKRTTQAYHEDMAALGALNPDIEPRATHHIAEMISMIEKLIDKGFAYAEQGHVLFQVDKYPNYGALSRRNTEELIAGARVEIAPYKRNATDFVLWKPSDDQTPGWNSPWGYGRPGWHIECSAMSHKYLGETFDIHGGGIDLVFPHHENEIAQSVCAHGSNQMARFWLHNGHLTIEGEKMSKSLGNFVTVRTLLESYPGEIIRLALMMSHYRQPLLWGQTLLHQAYQTLNRFYGALRNFDPSSLEGQEVGFIDNRIKEALADDLNTPQAIAYLHEIAGRIYKLGTSDETANLQKTLWASSKLLGLCMQTASQWFHTLKGGLSADDIERLIKERNQARKDKDYARADIIRKELIEKNIILEDTPEGTLWRQSL